VLFLTIFSNQLIKYTFLFIRIMFFWFSLKYSYGIIIIFTIFLFTQFENF